MDQATFRTYKQFNDIGLAEELAGILKQNNIDYLFEDTTPHFDVSFANNRINDEYRIKIKPLEFVKVNDLLEKYASAQLSSVESDYYLYSFSNKELLELIAKKDEWSEFDYLLAQYILKERNVDLDAESITKIENERMQFLTEPTELKPGWLYMGFLFALLGGVFGVLIGWHISTNSKTLSNGTILYSYSELDRNKGKWMLLLGMVVFAACFINLLTNIFKGL